MDLLSTTCHVLKQTGDTRSAYGPHSHPSSMCAALLRGETPEFLRFGAGVWPQKLPPTVLWTFLALGLPRNLLLNAAKAHCKRIPPVWPRTYMHPPERRSFQERQVPQPSLARSITTIWGISLAEICRVSLSSKHAYVSPALPAQKRRDKRCSALEPW